MYKAIKKMLDRKVAGGANKVESVYLLESLLLNYTDSRLEKTLTYNGFATEKQAEQFVKEFSEKVASVKICKDTDEVSESVSAGKVELVEMYGVTLAIELV